MLNVYKPPGLTPLQTIKLLRAKYPQYQQTKLAYAGRLDPLAHGVLLLLQDEECKQRDQYQQLTKEYEFQILFGIKTDSQDVLGRILEAVPARVEEGRLVLELHSWIGKRQQPYPIYSSKHYQGKAYYWWARQGMAEQLPKEYKEIEVYELQLLGLKEVSSQALQKTIFAKLSSVKGDFQQDEILKQWEDFFRKNDSKSYQVCTCRCLVSSGTYVRLIAEGVGNALGLPSLALDIIRTKVGEHSVEGSLLLGS